MELNRQLLNDAAKKGVLSESQAQNLWIFLSEHGKNTPSFQFTHILYYLGGLLAIGAMTLFMNLGWENFGGWGLLSIALIYAGIGLWLTDFFLYRRHLPIPAGIMAAFVVVLTPMAVYGLQQALGWWAAGFIYRDYFRWVDWRWIFMEAATLITGAILLRRYRLPFSVMPVAVTLWFMSMDLGRYLFGDSSITFEWARLFSLWFGLGTLAFAFLVDIRSRDGKDFAFWLYIFGVITFWTALSCMKSDSELSKFLYLCINLGMIVVGAILSRRVFAVFGGLGAAAYVSHLAYSVFKDSMLFPFVLTLFGFAVIYIGVLWQRHEHVISYKLRALLPSSLRELVERRS